MSKLLYAIQNSGGEYLALHGGSSGAWCASLQGECLSAAPPTDDAVDDAGGVVVVVYAGVHTTCKSAYTVKTGKATPYGVVLLDSDRAILIGKHGVPVMTICRNKRKKRYAFRRDVAFWLGVSTIELEVIHDLPI